ncbi:AP-2 complex subunit mu [Senna tora]|uniref:AP-2 complex subunit mu n=1 Tax=Senna tora TaxID=362788 RepID=A0A834WAH0_9FABA|nr:AP-2 complex subunit mu [Senna tora]
MPVAASAIYFLNLRGDVLINRLYRDDVGGNMVDAFRTHIMQTKELGTCPVRQIGGCSFFYMRISNVYIVIVVSSNANVACAFKFVVEGDLKVYGGGMIEKFMSSIIGQPYFSLCFALLVIHLPWLKDNQSIDDDLVCAVALFKSYFGGAFDEDAIRNNFVLIYELLDDGASLCLCICHCNNVIAQSVLEIMDFGYPQNLSPEILKLYITQEGVRSPFSSKPTDRPVPNATLQVTGAVGWRREGLVYKKNEVFLDIVESVNLLMSSKGSVLRCDVTGKILMKCFLSGMPDLKLGLNDKIGLEKESQLKSRPTKSGKTIELDDVTFHQCVNLTRFNSEKTVSFVPPDGEFELMKPIRREQKAVSVELRYRITEGVNLPFKVLPTIKELGRTRMEVNVKVKSVFGAKMFALGVVVKIPVPKQTAKTSFTVTSGRAKYNASIDCLVWKIRKFPGQTEPTLSAEVELISTMAEKKSWTRPPIQMEFQVPMFTASGLRVRFLKVWEKSGYNTVEWVRYITKAGSYEVRI